MAKLKNKRVLLKWKATVDCFTDVTRVKMIYLVGEKPGHEGEIHGLKSSPARKIVLS